MMKGNKDELCTQSSFDCDGRGTHARGGGLLNDPEID